jgi:hypothetical protein
VAVLENAFACRTPFIETVRDFPQDHCGGV